MLRFAVVLLAAVPAPADDDGLSVLRSLLLPMRAHAGEHIDTRTATPELTIVKHALRDWIESRLGSLSVRQDGAVLAQQLNTELERAGFFCGDNYEKCPDQRFLGYLNRIQIHAWRGFLVVQTSVGIMCGFDDSAYGYEWNEPDSWRRFWHSEQDNYEKGKYFPQNLESVLIAQKFQRDPQKRSEKDRLILTLGTMPWCSSNWRDVYYRLWRTKSTYSEPKLLLDQSEHAYLVIDPPIQGSVTPDDVLIEYAVASIDGGVHNRRKIRRYVIDGDKVRRSDPVALSPRDFVEEWRSSNWIDSSRWTQPAAQGALLNWHRRSLGPWEFMDPTIHCERRPDLWQVGVDISAYEKLPAMKLYFLVRWRPPYHFTMVDIGDHPWEGCTQPDPQANVFRTLFPPQNWR